MFRCKSGPIDKVSSWLDRKMPGTIVEYDMYSSTSNPGASETPARQWKGPMQAQGIQARDRRKEEPVGDDPAGHHDEGCGLGADLTMVPQSNLADTELYAVSCINSIAAEPTKTFIILSFTIEDILANGCKDRVAAQQAFQRAMHQGYPSFKSTHAQSQLRHRQQHINGKVAATPYCSTQLLLEASQAELTQLHDDLWAAWNTFSSLTHDNANTSACSLKSLSPQHTWSPNHEAIPGQAAW
ncbi:hypothetical protein ABBQ38_008285 [Trebouxia sp. C0009 RCD-2024]